MTKYIKVRVTLGEKNYFIAKANRHEVKLNEYARSLLIGVDRTRFVKPKSRIKLESLLAMMKGTVRDLTNLGHNTDFYSLAIEELESAAIPKTQFNKEKIEFVSDEQPAMLHLHFTSEEILQIDRQAKLNNQSRNDYFRGVLMCRNLPDYQYADIPDEAIANLSNIWLSLREFRNQIVFTKS